MSPERSYIEILKANLIDDEGLRREPYKDTEGILTIGIGHNLESSPIPEGWKPPLTDDQIDRIFRADIARAIWAARDMFDAFDEWTDNRQAAVVNLLFNMGKGRFSKFITTIAAIRHRNWIAAGAGLKNSKWFKQVQPSRSARIIKQIVEG